MKLNMSFFIKDDELLKNTMKSVSNGIKKGFDTKPVCNDKYLKTKIKSYEGKINTKFYINEISKQGSRYICLSVILIYSVFKMGKNYYPQAFFEQSKYIVK